MANIGARIQETRLKKGLTLDRIADDTNISVRFLAKIENDDFTGFPGEPYIVGFIRNYADYLGLDPEEIVATYRRKDAAAVPPGEEPVAPLPGGEPRGEPRPDTAAPSQKTAAEASTSPAPEPGDLAGIPHRATKTAPKKTKKAKPRGSSSESGAAPEPTRTGADGAVKAARAGADGAGVESLQSAPITPAAAPTPSTQPSAPPSKRPAAIGIVAAAIAVFALIWIIAGGKNPSPNPEAREQKPTEYRVEGSPFEKRLYVGDSLLVPLGNDVYKIRLASITDTVNLETPFGPFRLSLGQGDTMDPDKNGKADATLIASDFEKNQARTGALLRVEFAPPNEETASQGEITIPDAAKAQATPAAPANNVILKSPRGPYPFVAQVTFRGNCMFRYEADRKEWVEKYYSKGENITINVNSSLTVWASNAQAAKLTFQASGGKTTDFEIGAPGEIAVKKISWSQAEGSWALISTDLD